jgi:hypothetical protein
MFQVPPQCTYKMLLGIQFFKITVPNVHVSREVYWEVGAGERGDLTTHALRLFLFQTHCTSVVQCVVHTNNVCRGGHMFCERV